MFNYFKNLIPGIINESSRTPSLENLNEHGISDYKVEIFSFNSKIQKWSTGSPGAISITSFGKPETSYLVIKSDGFNSMTFIRRITRNFELLSKDERTVIMRVSLQIKEYTDYDECCTIACRFSSLEMAKTLIESIREIQSAGVIGYENLNFRLTVIRKNYKREIAEKKSALSKKFPIWDTLINGKYYQNFYNNTTGDDNTFRCTAQIREFDKQMKKWSKLILGIVKIEYLKKMRNEQTVITVLIENDESIRCEIISEMMEIISLDERTCMWRGYKRYGTEVQSILIGCRFISVGVAQTFKKFCTQAQLNAPVRCAYRDKYMSILFEREYNIILSDLQNAFQGGFPLQDPYIPSTSREGNSVFIKNTIKMPESIPAISLSSFFIPSPWDELYNDEMSKAEDLCEYKAEIFIFDFDIKKWRNSDSEGTIKIARKEEIPAIFIVITENCGKEFIHKLTQDLKLLEKDSKTLIWTNSSNVHENRKHSLYAVRFKDSDTARELKNLVKHIQNIYSSELSKDDFELEILRELHEKESREYLTALEMDLPGNVDSNWLLLPKIVKLKNNNQISQVHQFTKGSLFFRKVHLFIFDTEILEWKKLSTMSDLVSIKREKLQELSRTLLYAISNDFNGIIIVKCVIINNFKFKLKNKTTLMWRGYVDIENGDLQSFLVACQFSNSEDAKCFKKVIVEIQHDSPSWRCSFRDEYLSRVLKENNERDIELGMIAFNFNH